MRFGSSPELGVDLGLQWRQRKASKALLRRELDIQDEVHQLADPENPNTVLVRGVRVPLKPKPPGPEDCCMSGMWDLPGGR